MTDADGERELAGDEEFAAVCDARREAWVQALESEGAATDDVAVEVFSRAG